MSTIPECMCLWERRNRGCFCGCKAADLDRRASRSLCLQVGVQAAPRRPPSNRIITPRDGTTRPRWRSAPERRWRGLNLGSGVFSPGSFGPAAPGGLGPTEHAECQCVDGNSSSTWPHLSRDPGRPRWRLRPNANATDPARCEASRQCRAALGHRDSVASRPKAGAAVLGAVIRAMWWGHDKAERHRCPLSFAGEGEAPACQ